MAVITEFPRQNIYLIGARASGKSTIGKIPATQLGWSFAETDELAQEILGRSISAAVNELGWEVFRRAESESLKRLAALERTVVSTGGGIVLRQENCELMHKTGTVVYLKASACELEKRLLKNSGGRPSLTGAHPAKEIAVVLEEREALYEALAHLTVNAHSSAREVAKRLAAIIRRGGR